jgi:hypothetical protein
MLFYNFRFSRAVFGEIRVKLNLFSDMEIFKLQKYYVKDISNLQISPAI